MWAARVSADNPGMSNGPWPLPARNYAQDPRPPRGTWPFKLATALLLALLSVPFMPESVRLLIPEGWRLLIPRVEFVRPGAGADSLKSNEQARNERATIAADLSLDAPALEAHEEREAPKPVAAPPARHPRPVRRRIVQAPPDEDVEPENVQYQPDYAVSMIPTRIQTEVRLSAPPAGDAGQPDVATRPSRDNASAALQDSVRADAADDDKDWPLLCGQVVDGSGAPVSGARVDLESPRLTVSTDVNGRFCVACPTGDRTVRIDAAGRGHATRGVALKGSLFEMRIELSPAP